MPLGLGSDLDWPELSDLKLRLDITSDDYDGQLDVLLAAAIAQIKEKVGLWDEMVDMPDEALAAAALQRAFEMASTDASVIEARKSEQLLFGHRRRFGVA